jgi:hypothetical protein
VNNNFKILKPNNDTFLNIPIEIKWDLLGRDDDIDRYEKTVLDEVLPNKGQFEIARYSHNEYGQNNFTSLNYEFYFYSGLTNVTASTVSNWINSYITPSTIPPSFSVGDVYYYRKPFTQSFFKLDFYNTTATTTQKLYFTIILPVQQGLSESVVLSPLIPNVNIKKPSMILDFVGDKEGFFIYWLRSPEFDNIDTFYMTAKFFDSKNGVFVRMMTEPQSSLPNKFIFDTGFYFYRKVVISYVTNKYEIFDTSNNRIGTGTPIKWYEYINP